MNIHFSTFYDTLLDQEMLLGVLSYLPEHEQTEGLQLILDACDSVMFHYIFTLTPSEHHQQVLAAINGGYTKKDALELCLQLVPELQPVVTESLQRTLLGLENSISSIQ
ncbi:MAG: hypothetical protein H6774_04195 [Pseudomonadales bacterium]|nr:hypothetical protein [Candidatus Woesebacteria bacterium]MCB9802261.1 hypothetical protein [Pseudomonadales bacterium]